ncbi:MAG: DUF58 domain-containing protein [Propionibacteriaceae bacterium]|jgi:uncharacterized protein (DUF58 family)|nr:DUF58 domain-containing protein [Propionibacteriaceae bacterium]
MSEGRHPQPIDQAGSGRKQADGTLDWAEVFREWAKTVTANGWAVVCAVAVAAVLVGVWAWVEAGMAAVAGSVALAVGVASVIGRSAYRVEVELPSPRVTVGGTVIGSVRVVNTRNGVVRASEVELPISSAEGARLARFQVPMLAAGEEWSDVFAVPARRRGVVVLGPAQVVRSDALGLLRRVRRCSEPVRLYVNPRTIRVPFSATGFQADAEGVATARLSSSDVSFHALRDYAPGDDRRFVHWPTSAKLDRLVVRQFEETRRSHHLILLDTEIGVWGQEDFEIAVEIAASLARAGLTNGRRVSLATGAGWVSTGSPGQLLDELTELAPQPGGKTIELRLREALAARRDTSVLTIITGADAPAAQLGHWVVLAGVDIAVGVVRVAPSLAPSRVALGAAELVCCPGLEEFPRLIERRGGR